MKALWVVVVCIFIVTAQAGIDYTDPKPFGADSKFAENSDNAAIGEWWNTAFDIVGDSYIALGDNRDVWSVCAVGVNQCLHTAHNKYSRLLSNTSECSKIVAGSGRNSEFVHVKKTPQTLVFLINQ